jgi:hypothetical protein
VRVRIRVRVRVRFTTCFRVLKLLSKLFFSLIIVSLCAGLVV